MGRKEEGIPELLFNCLTYSDKANHMLSPHNICSTQAIVHSLIKPWLVMKQFFHTSGNLRQPQQTRQPEASVWCTLMDGSNLTLSSTMNNNNNKHNVLLDKLKNIMHLKEDPDLPSIRQCTRIFGFHFP
jgi:hypothetical protein